MFRYVVISVKVISRGHLEVKLVIAIECSRGIEKNYSNESCRGHEGLFFGGLNFKLDLEVNLGIDSAS